MKQIKAHGLSNFLKDNEDWLEKRKECAEKRGIKYCDECGQWSWELLKREVLVPIDLQKFKEVMIKLSEGK